MAREITVIKLNHDGTEATRYPGNLLEEGEHELIVETIFPFDVANETFFIRKGDRLLEYSSDQLWYNIFQVHAGQAEEIRGWYCNIVRPMKWDGETIAQEDLELDVWVTPHGGLFLLDMEEFMMLPVSEEEKNTALAGLQALEERVHGRVAPFDRIIEQE